VQNSILFVAQFYPACAEPVGAILVSSVVTDESHWHRREGFASAQTNKFQPHLLELWQQKIVQNGQIFLASQQWKS
jgi:hypothetical protein